ncbi:ABC transporter substrate-binding protein [Dongshaea marina]|uniref:ABC transporter substrate-binding protein n=1 Tax=Dongshaea marina TaxID=2047966 RepID=UPI000D3E5285|nr:ABC transporter substrate-binding protein [Dongshaea marina]
MFRSLLLTLCILLGSVRGVAADPIRVVLLNPQGDHWFWEMIIDFMQASADDLGMELEVLNSNRNYHLTIRQAREVVQRDDPPDYLITGNEKSIAGEIIRISDRAGVKVFLFNNGFVSRKAIKPRDRYKNWIGEFIPDNFSAGYQMGAALIQAALDKGLYAKDGKVHLAAIAGADKTHASTERVKGLMKAISEHRDQVRLLELTSGNWTQSRAYNIAGSIFSHYGDDIQAFWGANDTTAFGAMEQAQQRNKTLGKDILFAGCGWYPPAIKMVSFGTMLTTVGGHFMDGAG